MINFQQVKHSELAAGVEQALNDIAFLSDNDVDMTQLAMRYPPIIHSGGNYQLNYSAGSDDNYLQSGPIVCSFGVRYKSYCCNIARTLFVNSTFVAQQNFNFVLDVERKLLIQLIPGAKLNEIYESTMEYARAQKPLLVDHLVKTFGFSIGMEFDENSLIIGPECMAVVKENMVFNVSIGLNGVTDKDGKAYALLHSDTIIVNKFGPALVTTPPPYQKLIADCWTHVFDYLSLGDVLVLGRTCKYMNQMAGKHIHDNNLPNHIRIVTLKIVDIIINDDISITLFPNFDQNLSIQEQLNSMVDTIEPDPSLTMLSYYHDSTNTDQIDRDWNTLPKKNAIAFNACTLNASLNGLFFNSLQKQYQNLKYLAINQCTTSTVSHQDSYKRLFLSLYPKLEHLKYIPRANQRIGEIRELKDFLEKHGKLKHLEIESNFFWENVDVINRTNIRLDRLTIHIIRLDNHRFDHRFVNLLKRLHARGFYKSLNFSMNCFAERKFSEEISTLHALNRNNISDIDESRLIDLKSLNIDTFAFEFRLETPVENPKEFGRLFFCSAKIGDISQFICYSKKLKIVKIDTEQRCDANESS